MGVFADNLLAEKILNPREAKEIANLEVAFTARLTFRSDNEVWSPLLVATTDQELVEVANEVCDIIAWAKTEMTKAAKNETAIRSARAEVYRSKTLNWYIGIKPELALRLSKPLMSDLDAHAAGLLLATKRSGSRA